MRSWLEQDTSCPTCRKSLQDEKPEIPTRNLQQQQQVIIQGQQPNLENQPGQQPPLQQQQRFVVGNQRNLFHFDGSRYISWLPSFSLQVTNGGNILPSLLRSRRAPLTPERLNEMTQQVSQLFPHLTLEQIQNDLRQTHSVETTIENILEDRLLINQLRRNPNGFLNDPNDGDLALDNGLGSNGVGNGGGNTDQDSDLELDDDDDEDSSSTDEDDNNSNNNNNINNGSNDSNGALNNSNNLLDGLSLVRQRNSLFSLVLFIYLLTGRPRKYAPGSF